MFCHPETERQLEAWNPCKYKTRASQFVHQLEDPDPNSDHGSHFQTSSGKHPYNCLDQVLWKI